MLQVFLTLGLIAAVAVWVFVALRKLAVMRTEVTLAWKKLDADRSNDAIKHVYNKHVAKYNEALDNFPANVVGPMAGFKPARPF